MTDSRYLEITYRRGRPVAGYLYLDRREGDKAARTERRAAGLVVDFAEDGRVMGIEITAPTQTTTAQINELLTELHAAPATADDLHPLTAH